MERIEQELTSHDDMAMIKKLVEAIKEDDFERYCALIEKEPVKTQQWLLQVPMPSGTMRSIHCAAQKGNVQAVKKLLRLGVPLNDRTQEGMTPLLYAAKQGSIAVLKVLLENGADTSVYDKEGRTVLHWAAACNNVAALEMLIKEYGLDVNSAPRFRTCFSRCAVFQYTFA